jgi:hypothetical protein
MALGGRVEVIVASERADVNAESALRIRVMNCEGIQCQWVLRI